MNYKLKTAISFAFGVGIGYVISHRYSKQKFNKRLEVEIDSVRKVFKDRETQTKANISKNKPKIDDIIDIKKNPDDKTETCLEENKTKNINYASFYQGTDDGENGSIDSTEVSKTPYVITPNEFGTMGYTEITLTYFQDGVLVEDGDEIPLPIDQTIGEEAIKHFGEYARDAVYVRNEKFEIDYEVIKVDQTYEEATGKINPNKRE